MYEPGQDSLNQKPVGYDPFNPNPQQNYPTYNEATDNRIPVNNNYNNIPIQGNTNYPNYNQVHGNIQPPTNTYNYTPNNYAPIQTQQPPRYIPPPINNVNVTPIVVNTGGVQTHTVVPNTAVISHNQEEHTRRNRIITIVSICVVVFAVLFVILRFAIVFG